MKIKSKHMGKMFKKYIPKDYNGKMSEIAIQVP